jgi:hypothetical protein
MRIHAAPVDPAHGGALAREVLRAVDGLAGNASVNRNGSGTGDGA